MLLMSSIIKAKHIKHKGVELITCKSMEIEADRPLVVHTDGEFAGKYSNIRFSCIPEKVKILLEFIKTPRWRGFFLDRDRFFR